jgi:hypothetical protein
MEGYSDEFNNTIKALFNLFRKLPSKMLSKMHIERLHAKMIKSMRAHTEYAITILGPYVWAAREEISNGNAQYFLNREYGAEIMELSRTHKFDYDDALKAIGYMKEAYRSTDDATRTVIMNQIKTLLQVYTRYVIQCKQSSGN